MSLPPLPECFYLAPILSLALASCQWNQLLARFTMNRTREMDYLMFPTVVSPSSPSLQRTNCQPFTAPCTYSEPTVSRSPDAVPPALSQLLLARRSLMNLRKQEDLGR